MDSITCAVLHAIERMHPRLRPRGVVANPLDTCGYRCGLRLATRSWRRTVFGYATAGITALCAWPRAHIHWFSCVPHSLQHGTRSLSGSGSGSRWVCKGAHARRTAEPGKHG